MGKIERYQGNVKSFASEASQNERTIFGEASQSDCLTDNITTSFKRGWGIVDSNSAPTLQDFNAMAYTLGQFIAYLHQQGVAEWHNEQEYHKDSVVIYNGKLYISKVDDNVNYKPDTNKTKWSENTPKASETMAGVSAIASTEEIVNLKSDSKIITPKKIRDFMDKLIFNGHVWQEKILPNYSEWCFCKDERDTIYALAKDDSKIYISTDGGHNWYGIGMDVNMPWTDIALKEGAICAISGNKYFAVVSYDRGNSWEQSRLPFVGSWDAMCCTPAGTFCAVSSGTNKGVTSTDGKNWAQKTLPNTSDRFAICATTTGAICLLPINKNECYISRNEGNTWQTKTLPSNQSWYSVCSAPNGIICAIALNSNKGAVSKDDGETWTEITLPSARFWSYIASTHNNYFCVSDATGEKFIISKDNGDTWIEKNPNHPAPSYKIVTLSNGNICLFPNFGNRIAITNQIYLFDD